MKKLLLLAAGVLSAISVYAQKERAYTMEKNDFRATFTWDARYVSYEPGGVTGRCFKAALPAKHPKNGFAVHSHERQLTKLPEEIEVSGMFKGKGSFSIGFIVYDREKIFWITKAPGSYSPRYTINSDKWEKKTFVFRPAEENVQRITGFLTMVSLAPGAEIWMDDIKTRIVERKSVTDPSKPAAPSVSTVPAAKPVKK